MRTKKLFVTNLILVLTIIAMVVCSVFFCVAKKPAITEHDFPFSITYELDGKTETIDAVYSVRYAGNNGYVDVTGRVYEGEMTSDREGVDTSFVLGENQDGEFILYTRLHADHLMGDPWYDYYDDDYPYAPVLTFTEWDGTTYEDELSLAERGAKIISWEYPEPIENSFVYSHLTHLNSEVVFPLLVIAVVALLLIVIFVKKDQYRIKKPIDTVSLILNFVIALVAVPVTTLYGAFSDIAGSSGELLHVLGYLVPAITVLGLAASVALRRRGCRFGSFVVQFIGPVVFVLDIVCILVLS